MYAKVTQVEPNVTPLWRCTHPDHPYALQIASTDRLDRKQSFFSIGRPT
jgi:hypothetical protein